MEVWRKLGVNVGAMGSSQPDLEWIYSTIQGPPVPPSGYGGNKFFLYFVKWADPGLQANTSYDFRVCPSLLGSNWVF